MKNPLTGKDIQTSTLTEFTRQLVGKEQHKSGSNLSQPDRLKELKDEILSLKAENELYRIAFSEMAKPETNSIAKIRAIAERLSDELNGGKNG